MQISRQSYVEFFLLYTDGELGADEKRAVEAFVKENPDLEEELVMMQQTVFTPDDSIVFEDKEQLYRKEEERRVIPWFRLAAAAILLITFSMVGWLYLDNKKMVRDEQVASSDLQPARHEPIEKSKPAVATIVEEPENGKRQTASGDEETAKGKGQTAKDNSVLPRSLRDHPLQRGTGQPANSNRQPASGNEYPPLAGDEQTASGNEYPPLAGVARSAGDGQPANGNRQPAMDVDKPATPTITPEHTLFEQDVAIAEIPVDDVEVRVSARHIQLESEPTELQTAKVSYVEAEEPEMIYFANTTIPKKSKLRGVIRKATRILDKVTSFQ